MDLTSQQSEALALSGIKNKRRRKNQKRKEKRKRKGT
jgi:hypothetical protein